MELAVEADRLFKQYRGRGGTVDRERQVAEAAFAGDAWQGRTLVFTTPLRGWIDPNNFSRTMDALVDQVGVPRITPRGLRHTHSRSAGSWSATTR